MVLESPFNGQPSEKWVSITKNLLDNYPIGMNELAGICLASWEDIFHSGIGPESFRIGKDLFPRPQVMGFFLHELIPLKLHTKYPDLWIKDNEVAEKDVVYLPDSRYSMEIKTSSSPDKIFGNRSYAQEAETSKKDKSGYYLAINFDKFPKRPDFNVLHPQIKLIRFGWLDHKDWIGQAAATGQQARLDKMTETSKLMPIYDVTKTKNSLLSEFI